MKLSLPSWGAADPSERLRERTLPPSFPSRRLQQLSSSNAVVWTSPLASWANGPFKMVLQGDGSLGIFGAPGSDANTTGKNLVVWNSRTGLGNGTYYAAVLNT